jgi:NADH-quinone oxidoreductase subunit N
VLLRLFDVALISASGTWGPALAALALITIVIGNVGAIGQSSLKRLLAYSSVAQAGYMLAGVVVSTRLGIQATIFYLAGYVLMNMAAFAVIAARERETAAGDDISSLYGLGADRPLLAWPMTIAMLSLAGFPATVGFFGKLYLIQAAVDNEYAWLGVAIVVGSAISLVYYLRVVAAVWMRPASDAAPVGGGRVPGARPAMAGGSQEADAEDAGVPERRTDDVRVSELEVDGEERGAGVGRRRRQPEVVLVAVVCGLATVAFGIWPDPLFDLARDAGASIASLV